MVSLYHYIQRYRPDYKNCSFVDHLRESAAYWQQNILNWHDQPGVVYTAYEDYACDYQAALAHCLEGLELPVPTTVQNVYGAFHPKPAWQRVWQRLTHRRKIELTSVAPHKGIVGGWTVHFGPEEKAVFKELAGDALIRLGYEQSHEW
jgi:hypothetical protein